MLSANCQAAMLYPPEAFILLCADALRNPRLRGVAVLLLQVFGEHAVCVDLDKRGCARRQHLAFAIANLRRTIMLAAAHCHLPAFDDQRLEERHGFQIRDLHLACQSDEVVQLIDLPHSLVKNGGNDSAVSVRRRTNEAPLQAEAADEALALLVENKLQPESGFVGGAATKTVVGELLFLYLVTMNSLVAGHVVKMNESGWKCKETLFAVRDSLFADPLHIVIPSGVRAPQATERSRGICGHTHCTNRRSLDSD